MSCALLGRLFEATMLSRIMSILLLLYLTLHAWSRSGKGHRYHYWSQDSDWKPNWHVQRHTQETSWEKHLPDWIKAKNHDGEERPRWKFPSMEEESGMRHLEKQLEKKKAKAHRIQAMNIKCAEQIKKDGAEKKKSKLEESRKKRKGKRIIRQLEQEIRAEKKRLLQERRKHVIHGRRSWKHRAATRNVARELGEEKKKYQRLKEEVDKMKIMEKEDHNVFAKHLELQRKVAERNSQQQEANLADLQSKLDANVVELELVQNRCEKSCHQSCFQNMSAMAAEYHHLSEVLRQEKDNSSQLCTTLQKEKELSSRFQSSVSEPDTTNVSPTFLLRLSAVISMIILALVCCGQKVSQEELEDLTKQLKIKNNELTRHEEEMKSEFGGMMKLGDAPHYLNGDLSYHIFDDHLDQGKVRSIKIQCPGVSHSDIHIDIVFNGCVVNIDRKQSRGVAPIQWTQKFQFMLSDGLFEFKEDQASLEAGILLLVFRAFAFERRVFRFPKHFDIAHHDINGHWHYPEEDTSNGKPSAHATAGTPTDSEDYHAICETRALTGIEEASAESPNISEEKEHALVTEVLSSVATSEGFEKIDVEELEMYACD